MGGRDTMPVVYHVVMSTKGAGQRLRVTVVDDDDVSRRGLTEILSDNVRIHVIGSLTHAEALRSTDWVDTDVLIVDAADERDVEDHFPGVEVVRLIREHRSSAETTVIVITGHFFDDAVRRRMREAHADLFFNRSDLQEADRVCAAVLNSEMDQCLVPDMLDPESAFRHGVTLDTRVNAAVAYAKSRGLSALLSPRSDPRSRAWMDTRRSFNSHAHLNSVNADGRPPERDQPSPSLPQIERFLSWATRTKRGNR